MEKVLETQPVDVQNRLVPMHLNFSEIDKINLYHIFKDFDI